MIATHRHPKRRSHNRASLSQERGLPGQLDLVLATVSHELRRPLSAILGWTRLLRSGGTTDLARGLEVIERSANQQRLLIEELLDLSRLTSAGSLDCSERVDLNDVLRIVGDAAQPAAAEKKVQLASDLAGQPVWVRGDPPRLQQIFGNLVANAIKFTPPPGRITLSLSCVGCEAVAEVADTGVGIAAGELPKIFEPFWQADGGTSPLSRDGLGLGLAIVRRFVELHGGTIAAASAGPGCGTSMIVRLPLDAHHET